MGVQEESMGVEKEFVWVKILSAPRAFSRGQLLLISPHLFSAPDQNM